MRKLVLIAGIVALLTISAAAYAETNFASVLSGEAAVEDITQCYVYGTPDGTVYHTDPECLGIQDMDRYTLGEMMEQGRTGCLDCCPTANDFVADFIFGDGDERAGFDAELKEIMDSGEHDYHGAVVMKDAIVYANGRMADQVATIPAYTAIRLDKVYEPLAVYWPYGPATITSVADYSEGPCYIYSDVLLGDISDQVFDSRTLPEGTIFYQRPDTNSHQMVLPKETNVDIIQEYQGWILIRERETKAQLYGFIKE